MRPSKLYRRYYSTHQIQQVWNAAAQLPLLEKYYRRNYLPLLPPSKEACIVDLGCGKGQFLSFLRSAGFCNTIGVDIAEESVEVCRQQHLPVEREDVITWLKKQRSRLMSSS